MAILEIASFLIENPAHSADAQESAYNRVLRTGELCCGYVNWNPYFITDPNNPKHRTGVNVEITEAIGQILDLKIVWAEEVGWGNLAEGLHTGRYDAVCTSIWPDGPKIKNLALSDAMFYDTLYVYARADDKRFTNMQSLNKADVKVAAVEGGPSYEIAHNAFPAGTITAISPNAPTADFFLTVTTKKADILVTSPSEFKAFDDSKTLHLPKWRIGFVLVLRLLCSGLGGDWSPVARGPPMFRFHPPLLKQVR